MTKTKILIASVAVLAILNIALLGFMVLGKKGHHKKCKSKCHTEQRHDKHSKNHKGKFEGMIGEKLGFDDNQKEQFKTLKKAHFEQIKEHHEAKRAITKELFSLLKEDSLNTDQKTKLIGESVALEQKMIELKINHFAELKSICNPDQLDGFFKMIEKMENKMPHRKGPHQGPHAGMHGPKHD